MPRLRRTQRDHIPPYDIARPNNTLLASGVVGIVGHSRHALALETAAEEEVDGAEDGGVGADDADVDFGDAPGCVGDGGPCCVGWGWLVGLGRGRWWGGGWLTGFIWIGEGAGQRCADDAADGGAGNGFSALMVYWGPLKAYITPRPISVHRPIFVRLLI